MIPLGHKYNPEISNEGIDTVTGLRATTGGVNASGNPVVPVNHPAAQAAMRRNKTGPYKVVTGIIDSIKEKIAAVKAEHPELSGSGSEKYGAGDWTKTEGQGITDNTAPKVVVNPPAAPVTAAPTLETKPTT